MTIGIDCSRAFLAERTGTENYTYYLVRALLALPTSHSYRLYVRNLSGRPNPEWLTEIRGQLPVENRFELVLIPQKRLWTQFGLAVELWKNHVDVLFVPAHTLPLLRPRSVHSVVTIHDLGYEYLATYHQFPHRLWLTYFTEYAVNRADRLIAVSEATKQDLISKLHAESTKITVIYEALSGSIPDRLAVKQTLMKFQLTKPYIVFVGTVQPRKNLARAIEAFAALKKSRAAFSSLEFVIIGKKGWLSEEIYAAPRRYGVEDAVRFLGYVSDEETMQIWSHAELTFYATLFEGFGLPILVSQQLRVPVVTSKREPFMEVGGDACLFVNPESVEELAEGIGKILDDGELRIQLIDGGERNIRRFSWEKAAKETLVVLEVAGQERV